MKKVLQPEQGQPGEQAAQGMSQADFLPAPPAGQDLFWTGKLAFGAQKFFFPLFLLQLLPLPSG